MQCCRRPTGRQDADKYVQHVRGNNVQIAHMLTWLHMAFSIDVEVERYVDRAYGRTDGP